MTSQATSDPKDTLLDQLYSHERVSIRAELALEGARFLQPTSFPDIGFCIYRDKDGDNWCLVESEQSMANRLESVCMRSPGVWVDDFNQLPVIVVKNEQGKLLATNLTEPHRIASSYILESKITNSSKSFKECFEKKIELLNGKVWPLDKRPKLEQLVFALDPAALLHGFQFVEWGVVGLRQTRLLHARLEATLAPEPEVSYGMVKLDQIEPGESSQEKTNMGQSISVKGRIIPEKIIAMFDIDVLGIRNLSLDDDNHSKFLFALALWKIGAFLSGKPSFDPRNRATDSSLRLRTDCYLSCNGKLRWTAGTMSDKQTSKDEQTLKEISLEDLVSINPTSIFNIDFSSLIKDRFDKECLGDDSGRQKDDLVRYAGPVVEVTYARDHNRS